MTRGKAAVKVCTEWSRKPLTSAEALLAERPAASSKSPGVFTVFRIVFERASGCRQAAAELDAEAGARVGDTLSCASS